MATTENSTACPECRKAGGDQSGDNLKWFRNQYDKLTSKCVKCGYQEHLDTNANGQYNNQQGTNVSQVLNTCSQLSTENSCVQLNTNQSSELLTTGRYESLYDRGISEETCRKYYVQVGELHGKPIHIYNYLDKDGSIVAQKIRFTQTKEFIWRGKNESLFGQRQTTGSHRIYVFEGELDALTGSQVLTEPCVSISTGAGDQTIGEIKRHLDWLEQFEKIVLVFDADQVGNNTAREVAELFTPGKCYILPLGMFKDPNEYLKAGKIRELEEELRSEGIKFEPECIITPDLAGLLVEDQPRIRLPYPQLQEYVRGISQDEGELWLLGAGAKSGKSTFTKELLKGLLDSNAEFKAAVCYTEESVKKAAQTFIAMDHHIPIQAYKEDISLISPEDAAKSYNKYIKNKRIKFIDISKMPVESKKIMNVIRHLVIGSGYKFILLDHLTFFTYDMDSRAGERKDIDMFLRRIKALTTELNCTILCVCHLVRAGDGKDYSEGRAITMRDFRGSGSFEQLCDVMLGLERNSLDEYEKSKAKLKVLANRITGNAGYVDELYHNPQTGRLSLMGDLFK